MQYDNYRIYIFKNEFNFFLEIIFVLLYNFVGDNNISYIYIYRIWPKFVRVYHLPKYLHDVCVIIIGFQQLRAIEWFLLKYILYIIVLYTSI